MEDLIQMLTHLAQSSTGIQRVVSAFAYVLGIYFIFHAIGRLKVISNARPNSPSQVKMLVPIAYILTGAMMIFLPTMVQVASNSFFGAANVSVLGYGKFNVLDLNKAMYLLINMAGVIWFVRGCVLIAHGSNPGFKHGKKGWVFLIAGILAINFKMTTQFLAYLVSQIVSFFP